MTRERASEPPRNCRRCPRLVALRRINRAVHPAWHNAPVPSFGPLDARLLIVGLAPGLKGANRTGRPFSGDRAGALLYGTLIRVGLARGDNMGHPGDGLELVDCRVTNALRCVPPANRPTGPELLACRRFLAAEIAAMTNLTAIVALGVLAHRAVLAVYRARPARHTFAHGRVHGIAGGIRLIDSYHCSRQNTNTGRLTPAMFEAALATALAAVGASSARA